MVLISDEMLDRLGELLEKMRGKRVLVIGDVLADEYIDAETARVSREAPVLILRRLGSRVIPGGAGNAVLNIQALGAIPIPIAVLGEGEMAACVVRAFGALGIDSSSLLRAPHRKTVRKTRIMAGGAHGQKQQILRIDDEEAQELSPEVEKKLVNEVRRRIQEADGVLLSDYGYGTLSEAVRQSATAAARERAIPVCADSRYDLLRFRGVTYATPNESEALDAARTLPSPPCGLAEAAERLRKELDARFLIVTRGQEGMLLALGEAFHEIPIWGDAEAADVTGAGDTVAATTLLAITCGASAEEAALLATIAAGIVVQKHGASIATPEEVERVAGIRRKNPQP
jgi:rfaE bifunctional protein kinase chain/domain